MRIFAVALILTKLLLVQAANFELPDEQKPRSQLESETLKKHRNLGAYGEPIYIGCYADTDDHALPIYVGMSITFEDCKKECTDMGAPLFGRQSWGECWCGSRDYAKHNRTKGCKCDAAIGENIGAWRQCTYLIKEYVGCYNDQKDDRALPYNAGSNHNQASCKKACRGQGYHFAGLQNNDECWCGGESPVDDGYAKHGKAATCGCESESSAGKANANCVYRVTLATLKGCYRDDDLDRALPHRAGDDMSYEECFDACQSKGYTLMGRQANQQCWCGGEQWYDVSFKKHGPAIKCRCHNSPFLGHWKQCVYRVPNRDENGKIKK